MIDTENETIVSLAQAARNLPSRSGKRGVSVSTVWRWAQRGIRGIRLETILIGGVRFTSHEALSEFFAATTAAANGAAAQNVSHARREVEIRQAEQELREPPT